MQSAVVLCALQLSIRTKVSNSVGDTPPKKANVSCQDVSIVMKTTV